MRLTRDELCDLTARIAPTLPELDAGTLARSNAQTSLGNIRRVMLLRDIPANAVIAGNAVYLFDVGSGAQRQIAAAKLQLGQIRAVFLSHHHIDHNADISPLLVTRWVLFGYKPSM
jgi:ribonuclease BN (tRNA processing enzyme)